MAGGLNETFRRLGSCVCRTHTVRNCVGWQSLHLNSYPLQGGADSSKECERRLDPHATGGLTIRMVNQT